MEVIKEAMKHTDIIAGIDLIGNEEQAVETASFGPELKSFLVSHRNDNDLKCFLTTGETQNRKSTNLLDAVLLESQRISHGYQLFAHPHLIDKIK